MSLAIHFEKPPAYAYTQAAALNNLLCTQVHHQVLVSQGLSLEASGQQDVLVVHGDEAEGPGCQQVELLEGLVALGEVIPQVHPGEGVVAAQEEILPLAYTERVDGHGAAGGQSLDLHEALALPTQNLGVTDEACEAQVEHLAYPEVFDHLHVRRVSDLGVEGELALAAVPLVDHRGLRRAGEDEPWLALYLQELHVGVTVPRVQGLMGIEAVAVPTVDAGGACLGTVDHGEVPIPFDLEGLHKVWLAYTGCVDILDLYKSQRAFLPSVKKMVEWEYTVIPLRPYCSYN